MQTGEGSLRVSPKFVYALPNFQAGVTLSLERRHKLIELADHYGVPIIEDDPYGQLRYEGEHLPPQDQTPCASISPTRPQRRSKKGSNDWGGCWRLRLELSATLP